MTQEQHSEEQLDRVTKTMSAAAKLGRLLDDTAVLVGATPGERIFAGLYIAVITAYSSIPREGHSSLPEELTISLEAVVKHIQAGVAKAYREETH